MTASTTVKVIAKDKKRRRTTYHGRNKKVLVLAELPLFPLTPGDLNPPPDPAAPVAGDPNVDDDALLMLRLGINIPSNDQANMMVVGHEEAAVGAAMVVEEEEEEEREVAWTIRKVLTKSDTNDCSRLLIANDLARQHVFPYLTAEAAERVESGGCKAEGAADVVVWDVDTGSEHRLQFRRWNSTRGYVFNNEWTGGFVRRRELKEGDEVGLCFDGRRGRFVFSVLKRAAN